MARFVQARLHAETTISRIQYTGLQARSNEVLTIGQCIGHYEIIEKLGEGGMGIVYKARDTHLDRFVAIKLLRTDRIGHETQLRRFALEARAASTLNHPNIITVHDISSENGIYFIVMEYVRGKALDQVIPPKGLRLSEALKIAIQIADALAAGAAAGIVHRDLKPSNIMVADSGLVKVVDFGLAKLMDISSLDDTTTMTNTQAIPNTREGTVLGTASYMSPEQAQGKPLDARSDIFSFGTVLYEMMTGQRAFRGETSMSTISAILRDEPQPASQVSSDVPHDLERIINRCLRKDPDRRFQTSADVRVALLELKEESDSRRLGIGASSAKRTRGWWIAAALIFAIFVIAVGLSFLFRSPSPQLEPQVTPFASYPGFQRDPAFSPDGNEIAFAWTGPSGIATHIYVKIIGTDAPLQLTSGEMSDTHPAWAPDGKSIAFLRALSPTSTGVYQIAPLGGHERQVAEIRAGLYSALGWSRDNKWLVTTGRQESNGRSQVFVISVGTGEQRALSFGSTRDEFYPALSPNSQFLAFSRMLGDGDWAIFTVPVEKDLRPRGTPRRLNTPYGLNRQAAWTQDSKRIVFANGGTVTTRLWEVSALDDMPARQLTITGEVAYQPAISRVGDRLAYAHDFNNANIWSVAVTAGGEAGPLKQAIASARSSWVRPNAISPDGKRVAFESNRSGPYGIWVADVDGSNAAFLFGSADYISGSAAWSPDGKSIAFDTRKDKKVEVYVIPADGGMARRVTPGPGDNLVPSWSHDGNWIYFDSNRTGRFEVFKVSSRGGDEIQVTHNGGWGPQESPDGKFLFYTRARAVSTPLLRMPTNGREETQVLPVVHERWWAVGDSGIWFLESTATELDPGLWSMENAAPERGNLRFLSFTDGAARTVSAIPKSPAGGLAISGDRRTLMFNQVDHRATEIVLVENFH
jgi:serine/threonine protein kinase/Tol biopolymer transport system component